MPKRISLALALVLGCAHARAAPDQVRRVPLRVAEGVLASPLSSALQAQQLREGLVRALLVRGFCLERNGEFEALLNVKAEMDAAGGAAVTLTIDDGRGRQIDELPLKLPALPATAEEAEQALQPLVKDLEKSDALRDLSDSAPLCPGAR
jgi:hypothetical protein